MRLNQLEKELSISLENIKRCQIDRKEDIHCENLIGATTLPLGIAGPLKIHSSKSTTGRYYIPLATTEGALVASVNRGCKVINLTGGAVTAVESVGATRGPVFKTKGIKDSLSFKQWLGNNFALLKKEAEKTSSHLKLLKFETTFLGDTVFVRFYFDTGKAMGMNMVTIATDSMIRIIEDKTTIRCLSISGNYCVDKKPAWANFILGRGKRVWAETVLTKKTIEKELKTTLTKMYQVWLNKCLIGSAISGSMGFNSHFANVAAAFFAATGQDLAHISEASMGMTTMTILDNKNLYVSVYLPDVMIGLVGGGTKLKTKKEALSIIGVNSSNQLAEVFGGAVLAGEISLLASLSEGSLAKVHKRLGR